MATFKNRQKAYCADDRDTFIDAKLEQVPIFADKVVNTTSNGGGKDHVILWIAGNCWHDAQFDKLGGSEYLGNGGRGELSKTGEPAS